MSFALFFLVLVSVSLSAFAQVALRKAMLLASPLPSLDQPITLTLHLINNAWLWAGMSCYALSVGFWLVVLSKAQVSVAYPMVSIGYVIAAVISVVFLGEAVGLARAAGIALICVGAFMVARTA